MGFNLTINKHDKLVAWLAYLGHNITLFEYVEAQALDKHFNAGIIDVIEALKLMLHVQNQKFVLLICPMKRVLEN